MGPSPNVAPGQHWLAARFNGKISALRASGSPFALWLCEVQADLAAIFNLAPSSAWENNAYAGAIYTLLEAFECIEREGLLPAANNDVFCRAVKSWRSQEMHVQEMREFTFALSTALRGPAEYFEMVLDGVSVNNETARAYCHRALAKLFHIIRLARQD